MTTAIATFGKFNIVHTGHNSVLEHMYQLQRGLQDAEIIVGFSSANRANRNVIHRLSDFRSITNNNITYSSCFCNNLFSFIINLAQSYDTVVLCIGTDRLNSVERLISYLSQYTNIIAYEVPRQANAPSSTAIRHAYLATNSFDQFAKLVIADSLLANQAQAILAYSAIQEERAYVND